MREIVLALTTVPEDFDARGLARALIELRVAACVTILPAVRSVYTWEQAVHDSAEQQLLIKTTGDQVEALWDALKARHPYDVPEFVVLPLRDGNPAYLRWVGDAVQSPERLP
jgi:periplasmic divalent cation tolerance protein